MELTTTELARVARGTTDGAEATIDGFTIDSREVSSGDVFVAIRAERDGHDFIATARAAGAVAVLCERVTDDGPSVVVGDSRRALSDAATQLSIERPAIVVGITGSVGKTSVKDLSAAAIGGTLRTAASEKSFNNELGVPLTILNSPDGTEVRVIEMGARGPGQIAELCAVALPSIGIVTCVASVHTELFGDLDGVAATKGELIAALPASGTAVLNVADPRVMAMASATEAEVVSYGAGGDVSANNIELDEQLRPRFGVNSPWGSVQVELAVSGAHHVENALAALAAACASGVPLAAAAGSLAAATGSPWRMDLRTMDSGARILNDAYNANPTSVRAGLDALVALGSARPRAVLGTMAELGSNSDAEHRDVAEYARNCGVEVVAVAEAAYGTESVADIDAAIEWLGPLGADDSVLVKGSRVAGLEVLAERLMGQN